MRRILAVTAAVGVLATACTDGTPDPDGSPTALFTEDPTAAPSAPDGTAAPSPTDATEIDVTTTPDPVTEEWAEAVINTLLAEYGEVVAEVLAIPVVDDIDRIPPDLVPRVEAIFDGQYEERRINDLDNFARDVGQIRARNFPADRYEGLKMTVTTVQYTDDDCVIALGTIDESGLGPEGGPRDGLTAWSLSTATSTDGLDGANPTEWAIVDQIRNEDSEGNSLPEATMLNASLSDYAGSLNNTCGS